MPSFAIHTICGKEILKELNFNNLEEKEFLIGNILPDVSRVRSYKKMDSHNQRKSIQDIKNITHFRIEDDIILSYPDVDKFLKKYLKDIQERNIVTLAYFFHLYTDYYYFKVFLPGILSFYDKDMKDTNSKSNVYYAKVNRTGEIIKYKVLFNKDDDEGIYKDYSISNKFLINKYKLDIDYDDLIEYIDQYGFNTNVKETKAIYAYYAVIKLRKYLQDLSLVDDELHIFCKEELDGLVDNIINSFKKDYGYLLGYYK